MAHTFGKKPRKPARGKTAPANYPPLHYATLYLPQKTEDGQPTFAHVYYKLWPQLREMRKLAYSTAKRYDLTMAKRILPLCSQEKAFAELDEDDFIDLWAYLSQAGLARNSLRIASLVIRALMDLAYEEGLTQTTLWGLPQFRILPEDGIPIEITPCADPQDEGNRLAELAVRTPRSISLGVEFSLAQGMINSCSHHGELVAGLIMLCLGCRTSEATGFSYRHLSKIRSGYWALVRYEISDKDSRVTRAGGKTNNAFRLLPVPRFLSDILLSRKRALEDLYAPEEIENMPLACKGVDYSCRCTQRELNEKLKNLYRQAGVTEDLMRTAYQDMRENLDLAKDCEGRATAYLCRHQFCTAMVYCGLSQGEIYSLMGHAVEDASVRKSDYANPDSFCMLADKMSRRPLIQMLDQLSACHTYCCQDAPVTVRADGDIDLFFPSAGQFDISLLSLERGDRPELEPEHVTVMHQDSFTVPRDHPETLSIRSALYTLGVQVWDAAVNKAIALPSPAAAIERFEDTGEPCGPAIHVIRPAVHELTLPVSHTEASIPTPPSQIPKKPEEQAASEEKEPPTIPASGPSSAPAHSGKPAPRVFGSASAPGTLYLLDSSGEIHSLPDRYPIRNRDLAGDRLLGEQRTAPPAALLCCEEQTPALILSTSGRLYQLAAGQRLDRGEFSQSANPAYQALRSGGILLQGPALRQQDGTITCLSAGGSIRRVSLARFRRIPPEGRQLVAVSEADPLVSACLCTSGSDVVLASAQGKVLRLSAADLRPVTAPGSQLYSGMALTGNDRAALCRPYEPDTEYLFITCSGRAVRLSSSAELLPHGRGSQGARQVRVGPGDQLMELMPVTPAVLLVSTGGRGLCIQTDSIPVTTNPAQGVRSLKLRPPNTVLAAIGMGRSLSSHIPEDALST